MFSDSLAFLRKLAARCSRKQSRRTTRVNFSRRLFLEQLEARDVPSAGLMTNDDFVNDLYVEVLNRPADAQGLHDWTGLLAKGVTRTDVATGILHSQENQIQAIDDLYGDLLHREADPQGRADFLALFAKGTTYSEARASVYGSPEYFQVRGGSTNQGFLDALYADELGRGLDTFGQQVYLSMLASGSSRTDVALSVVKSPEARTNLVTGWYVEFLGRQPDTSGLNDWVGQIVDGAHEDIILGQILGSNEYYAR